MLSFCAMTDVPDPRNGVDPVDIQDENGTDLLLLRENLKLTVEQRLLELEARVNATEQIKPVASQQVAKP